MSSNNPSNAKPLNAFCVDLEEWFHVCGVATPYSDPSTWDAAPSCVHRDTDVLMRLLDETGSRGTFLTVGWVADRWARSDTSRGMQYAGLGLYVLFISIIFLPLLLFERID